MTQFFLVNDSKRTEDIAMESEELVLYVEIIDHILLDGNASRGPHPHQRLGHFRGRDEL